MTTSTSPRGLALALIVVGIAAAVCGSIARIVTGDPHLMGIAAVGFALQFAGWIRHRRRIGGRS